MQQHTFAQGAFGVDTVESFKESCLLLDTGSTFNSACNAKLLISVTKCQSMKAISNGSGIEYNMSGPDVCRQLSTLISKLDLSLFVVY